MPELYPGLAFQQRAECISSVISMKRVVPRPSVCATGHPSPLAPSVSRRYSASQAPAVLRLSTATVTLRLAKLGYRGLRAIASLSLARSDGWITERINHEVKLAEREGLLGAFFAALSYSARKPGLGILPRPLSGKKVHWTFFFSASPLRLAPSGPPSLRSSVPNRSRRFWSNPTGSHPSTYSTIFLTRGMSPRVRKMAEREGFEPPEGCPSTVFKTAALNRSATSP